VTETQLGFSFEKKKKVSVTGVSNSRSILCFHISMSNVHTHQMFCIILLIKSSLFCANFSANYESRGVCCVILTAFILSTELNLSKIFAKEIHIMIYQSEILTLDMFCITLKLIVIHLTFSSYSISNFLLLLW